MESTVVLWHSHPHTIFFVLFHIYIYCIYNNHFWNTFFSILPGALKKIDKLASLLDNAPNYLHIWVRYPKEMDLYYTVITHISLHFQPREQIMSTVVVQIFSSEKKLFFFLFTFILFRLFSKNFRWLGRVQILNLLRNFFFFCKQNIKSLDTLVLLYVICP